MLCALAPAALSAQEPLGTVLIVRAPKDTAVMARIRAELEVNDLRVRELDADAPTARAPLASLAQNARARAALRMLPARNAVELWVASEGDAAGGGEIVSLPDEERDPALLALRATEALRARGLRLPRRLEAAAPAAAAAAEPGAGGSQLPAATTGAAAATATSAAATATAAAAASDAEQRAAAETRAREQAEKERAEKERAEKERAEKERAEKERAEAEAAEAEEEEADEEEADQEEQEADTASESGPAGDESLLYVELGPALAAGPGGPAAMWGGWANLRVQPFALWSFSAFGFVPFAGGDFSRPEGDAHLRSWIASLSVDLHASYRVLDLSVGVGMSAMFSEYRPDAAGMDLMSKPDPKLLVTYAPVARVAMQVELSDSFRLSARAVFGFSLAEINAIAPPPSEETIATWGRPFVLATIALEFGLPAPLRPR